MKIRIFLFYLILYYTQVTSSINIQCEFKNVSYWGLYDAYSCEVQNQLNITSYDLAEISTISRTHLKNRTDNDKICFYARNKATVYIPRGVERFFNNLVGIFIVQGGLKYLEQNDFKPFPNLTSMDFFGNKIEFLEEDLFFCNPNLRSISFDSNPIIHVGLNVSDNLQSLRSLVFYNCKCISSGTVNSSSEVKTLVSSLKLQCNQLHFTDMSYAVKDLNYKLKYLKPADVSKFIEKIETVGKDFHTSNFSYYDPLKRKLENLSTGKIITTSFIKDMLAEMPKKHEVKDNLPRNPLMLVMMSIVGITQMMIMILIYLEIRKE